MSVSGPEVPYVHDVVNPGTGCPLCGELLCYGGACQDFDTATMVVRCRYHAPALAYWGVPGVAGPPTVAEDPCQ